MTYETSIIRYDEENKDKEVFIKVYYHYYKPVRGAPLEEDEAASIEINKVIDEENKEILLSNDEEEDIKCAILDEMGV